MRIRQKARPRQSRIFQNGIESGRILLEDKSQTTFENFVNAKKIIEEQKDKTEPKIAFISSDFHLMRASVIASLVGVNVSSVPAPSPKKGRALFYVYEGLVFPLLYREYLGKHASALSKMKII